MFNLRNYSTLSRIIKYVSFMPFGLVFYILNYDDFSLFLTFLIVIFGNLSIIYFPGQKLLTEQKSGCS